MRKQHQHNHPGLRDNQLSENYNCLVIGSGHATSYTPEVDDTLPGKLSELEIDEYLPRDMRWLDLNISMNKKKRWELPDLLKEKVDAMQSNDVQVCHVRPYCGSETIHSRERAVDTCNSQ